MNKWIKRVVAFSFIVSQFLVIPAVSASSLENIQNKKNAVEEEVTQLQQEVNNGLEEVSEISIALDKLNKEIEEHQATISDTEQDIETQEVLVKERYEYTAEQLKAMQKSEVNQNVVISMLQAESLTDLVNQIYTASVLTGASEERLEEAQTEQEKLDAMKETLLANQEALDTKQAATVEQKEILDTKVAELSTTLADNQSQLEALSSEESAEIRRIAEAEAQAKEQKRAKEEAAAQEAAEQEAAQAESRQAAEEQTVSVASSSSSSANESSNSNKSNDSNDSKKSNDSSKPNESTSSKESSNESNNKSNDSSSAGEWMSVQATGYSTQQAGLSTHTATGIDLRVNPRVIAVDPSVIPLGSMVEIQGLGVYVAGDTGGAINGRIIDIHYPTVSQALGWGRRSVNVRIIN